MLKCGPLPFTADFRLKANGYYGKGDAISGDINKKEYENSKPKPSFHSLISPLSAYSHSSKLAPTQTGFIRHKIYCTSLFAI